VLRAIGKFLGLTGTLFVRRRRLVVWGSGELESLTLLCWGGGVGGW